LVIVRFTVTGKALQRQREALGISVGDVARALAVTPAAVTQLETRTQPRPETVQRYKAALKSLSESKASLGEATSVSEAVGMTLIELGRQLITAGQGDV
jgi:transcriptional regulator with XRE-family HTH domain